MDDPLYLLMQEQITLIPLMAGGDGGSADGAGRGSDAGSGGRRSGSSGSGGVMGGGGEESEDECAFPPRW